MVQVEFVNARGECFKLPKKLLKCVSKHIVLFTTAQFVDCLKHWVEQLEASGIKVKLLKPKHCLKQGQILGCSIEEFKTKADMFLVVSNGLFHAKALLLNNKKPVIVLNPHTKRFQVLTNKDIQQLKLWIQANLKAFFQAKKIGVLITTKPGQRFMQSGLETLKKIEHRFKEKIFYRFLINNIGILELENFSSIECWLNTGCPRVIEDFQETPKINILNIEELKQFLDKT